MKRHFLAAVQRLFAVSTAAAQSERGDRNASMDRLDRTIRREMARSACLTQGSEVGPRTLRFSPLCLCSPTRSANNGSGRAERRSIS